MGKIIDILESERKRPTAQDWDVVHMYKTGQFYTAYDWSAWIISVICYNCTWANSMSEKQVKV
jgi:hypothetical protein